jgi:hypothetical protein
MLRGILVLTGVPVPAQRHVPFSRAALAVETANRDRPTCRMNQSEGSFCFSSFPAERRPWAPRIGRHRSTGHKHPLLPYQKAARKSSQMLIQGLSGCGRHTVPAAPLRIAGRLPRSARNDMFQIHRAGPGRTPPRCPALGNWLCFAQLACAGRRWQGVGRASRCRAVPNPQSRNWLCFARSTLPMPVGFLRLALFCTSNGTLPRSNFFSIGFVCTIGPSPARRPPGAPACPSLGLFGAFAPRPARRSQELGSFCIFRPA